MSHYAQVKHQCLELIKDKKFSDCIECLEQATRKHPGDRRLLLSLNMARKAIDDSTFNLSAVFSGDDSDGEDEDPGDAAATADTAIAADAANTSVADSGLDDSRLSAGIHEDDFTATATNLEAGAEAEHDEVASADEANDGTNDGGTAENEDTHNHDDEHVEDDSDSGPDLEPRAGTFVVVDDETHRETPHPVENHDNDDADDAVDEYVELFEGFRLSKHITSHLYGHQREGVEWLFSQVETNRKGGILCDDTGLGKTLQIIALIQGIIDAKDATSVLIVTSTALIQHWMAEFKLWAPRLKVLNYHGGTERERRQVLEKAMNLGGHVLLTTYGLLTNRLDDFVTNGDQRFKWHYAIFDDGQQIKNSTSIRYKNLVKIKSRSRLLLIRTDLWKDLSAMWSYLNFVKPGLLGDLKQFKDKYEKPIKTGSAEGAPEEQRILAKKLSTYLANEVVAKYVLRRTKAEVIGQNNGPQLHATKEEIAVWTALSKPQEESYIQYLSTFNAKYVERPLVRINGLKKICDLPSLTSVAPVSLSSSKTAKKTSRSSQASTEEVTVDVDDSRGDDDGEEEEDAPPLLLADIGVTRLVKNCSKLNIAVQLLSDFHAKGHRAVVFASSRVVLEALEYVMKERHIPCGRLDSSRTHSERGALVEKFQRDSKRPLSVLLISKKMALGLTLTAADRVIIYDPSWKPDMDSEAIETVYRIGQPKDVHVYHLITCGTVEGKIYSKNIRRDTAKVKKQRGPQRRFNDDDLEDLFTYDSPGQTTSQHVIPSSEGLNELSANGRAHIETLAADFMAGVSLHVPVPRS